MGPIFGIKNFRVLCTHTVVANKQVNSWGPYPFYPTKTALLFHDVTAVWFMLYNFVAVILLLFKLSKGTGTMNSLYKHQLSSYSYTCFTLKL